MLDIVFGKKTNPPAVTALVDVLRDASLTGTLYIGYPVFGGDDATSVTDALLTCDEHGVVIFDLTSVMEADAVPGSLAECVQQRQRELRRKLNARLVIYEDLIDPDSLSLCFPLKVLTFSPHKLPLNDPSVVTDENLLVVLNSFPPLPLGMARPLNAAIQKTAALKPKKRRLNVRDPNSMGGVIKFLEQQIANLDKWQKNAAIESPEGPQRIRGLAGSGKTIILALKAAYLHANDSDANILVTFNTRSLYQQFKSLIRRFYYDQTGDEPNWQKLKILHAWGSELEAGVYSMAATAIGLTPIPFGVAKNIYGFSGAFKGVCAAFVAENAKRPVEEIYDYTLVDEAQDFPPSFFQLVYAVTKRPKRIVWAYDELQNLGDSTMPSVAELFGVDGDGDALVEIANIEGAPQEDILLPICYRNPPWILTVALGLGLGVKREGLPAQMFSDPSFWEEIGFECVSDSKAVLGGDVHFRRSADRSAPFFGQVLRPEESLFVKNFESVDSELEWVARDIHKVLTSQELDLNDILVVIPDPFAAQSLAQQLGSELKKFNYRSHLVGVTATRDAIFIDDSIAISGIFRAKGNEAPLVYVVEANYCLGGTDASRRRNVLFTALTRAKAWVKVCSSGWFGEKLVAEINAIVNDGYELKFRYPTKDQISKMQSAYRERTAQERKALSQEMKQARKLLQKVGEGKVGIDELPPDLLELIQQLGRK